MAKKTESFLRFDLFEDTGKTLKYTVVSKTGLDPLGSIRWYSNWRRYCFFPYDGTVFDAACLTEITEFIQGLMNARKSACDNDGKCMQATSSPSESALLSEKPDSVSSTIPLPTSINSSET